MEFRPPTTQHDSELVVQPNQIASVAARGGLTSGSDQGLSGSPYALTADEAAELVGTDCHAYLKYDFQPGVVVHRGIFAAIHEALDYRPHFAHRVGQRVCVTLSVADATIETQQFTHRVAAYIGSLLPNAELFSAEVGHNEQRRRDEARAKFVGRLDARRSRAEER